MGHHTAAKRTMKLHVLKWKAFNIRCYMKKPKEEHINLETDTLPAAVRGQLRNL